MRVRAAVSALFLGLLLAPLAAARPPAGDEDGTIEEQYVRANLERFLHPTRIEFLDDGRVHLTFNFSTQASELAGIFTPPVSPDDRAAFRWTSSGEFRNKKTQRAVRKKGEDRRLRTKPSSGLRISDRGRALLNCWFVDDVQAEIAYLQGTSFQARQSAVLVFATERDVAVGSNFGTQCVVYSGGKPAEARGKGELTLADLKEASISIGLRVRAGTFEALKGGAVTQSMKYSRSVVKAGRIGFLWDGGMAGCISLLEITGRLDTTRMFRVLRSAPPG